MITSKQNQIVKTYIEKLKNPDDFFDDIEQQLEEALWFQNIGLNQLRQIRNNICPNCGSLKIKKNEDFNPFDGSYNMFIDCLECESDFALDELESLEKKVKPS
jgi:acetone carboxylase gamma subunit